MKRFFFLFSFLGTLCILVWMLVFPPQYQPFVYEYPDEEDTQITFFGYKWETENVLTIEQLITEFMQENKTVNVLYESIKGRAFFPVLIKRIETGNGDDVFMIDRDTLLALARRGELVDLSDMPELGEYSDMALSQIREEDGSVFALPTSVSAFGLYCNLDLLKKHHVAIPRNRAEFLEACAVFRKAGVTPIVANNDISLKTLAMARGLPELYASGEPGFAAINAGRVPLSTYFRSGFELLEELCERGYIDRKRALVTEKTRDDLVDFAKGESPFMLTGVWASVRLRKMADFRYAITAYPVQEDGTTLVVRIDTRIALNARGRHLPEARNFLRHLIRPGSINRFCLGQDSFSPLKQLPSPAPALEAIGENLQNGRVVLGADRRFAFPLWELSRAASVRILEGVPAEQALKSLDEAVASSLSGGGA